MLVSVIVPIFNVKPYLQKCLESIVNQTYKNLEILLIDDSSTDGTWEWLQNHVKQTSDNRIIVFRHETNLGVSKARELGFIKSTGDCIMFVDSDDWLELTAVQLSVEAMQQYSVDVVSFSSFKNYPNKEIPLSNLGGSSYINKKRLIKLQEDLFGLSGNELRFPHFYDRHSPMYMRLIKRNLIAEGKIRFIDTRWMFPGEDLMFNLELMEKSESWYYMDIPLYHYRKSVTTSATFSHNAEYLNKWLIHLDVMRDWAISMGKDSSFLNRLKNRAGLEFIGIVLKETSPSNLKKHKEIVKTLDWVLSSTEIGEGVDQLQTDLMPIHWRFFYFLAKNRWLNFIIILGKVMRFLKARREY